MVVIIACKSDLGCVQQRLCINEVHSSTTTTSKLRSTYMSDVALPMEGGILPVN